MCRKSWRQIAAEAAVVLAALLTALWLYGCASYKGGKVVDGMNVEIGLAIPGTEWYVNALSYTGGIKVQGNDQTSISVTNEVAETNSYFGVVTMRRSTRMSATIEPCETAPRK